VPSCALTIVRVSPDLEVQRTISVKRPVAKSLKVSLKPCPAVGDGNNAPVPVNKVTVVSELEIGDANEEWALFANKSIVKIPPLMNYLLILAILNFLVNNCVGKSYW
jgi:hypothetical protein